SSSTTDSEAYFDATLLYTPDAKEKTPPPVDGLPTNTNAPEGKKDLQNLSQSQAPHDQEKSPPLPEAQSNGKEQPSNLQPNHPASPLNQPTDATPVLKHFNPD